MQNEPNLPYARGMPCPYLAKQTQFPHTKRPVTPYFSETNPISRLPGLPNPPLCETNPIYPAADLWKTKIRETNPIPHQFSTVCLSRNRNLLAPTLSGWARNATNPIPGPQPKNAKRTQFPA